MPRSGCWKMDRELLHHQPLQAAGDERDDVGHVDGQGDPAHASPGISVATRDEISPCIRGGPSNDKIIKVLAVAVEHRGKAFRRSNGATRRRPSSFCRCCIKSCASWRPRSCRRKSPVRQFRPTVLVHEAYVRLLDGDAAQQRKPGRSCDKGHSLRMPPCQHPT